MPPRPAPSPTTAAAPAPMNTKAKVPMNSARSLEARWFDIARSFQKTICPIAFESHCRAGAVCGAEGHNGAARREPTVSLGRDGSLRTERSCYAGAVCRVRTRAVVHMALLDVLAGITHRAGGVLE